MWVEGALAVDWVMAGMSLEGDEENLLLARVVAGTVAVWAESVLDSGAAADWEVVTWATAAAARTTTTRAALRRSSVEAVAVRAEEESDSGAAATATGENK